VFIMLWLLVFSVVHTVYVTASDSLIEHIIKKRMGEKLVL